jgi:hypothetical protein
MAQHERKRRRLRRLAEQESGPILYPCISRDFARGHLPPDVLAEMTEAACSCCRVPVLAHTPVFKGMQEMARRVGVDVAILCQPCGEEVTQGAEYTEMRFLDPQLAARLDRWDSGGRLCYHDRHRLACRGNRGQ